MHLIVQTYSLIELQQLRSELEKRGIHVHVSDEFTYAIPGMPGAEQPRGLWIALPEDVLPARQVIADLIGADRLEPDPPPQSHAQSESTQVRTPRTGKTHGTPWRWIAVVGMLALVWLLNAET